MSASGTGDHPHTDPGDGRAECDMCGKFVWAVTHSCKGVPVTDAATARMLGFLLARIAEDEIVVQMRQERGEGERDSAMAASYGRTHFVRDPTTPARVLAECEVKRRIVERASIFVLGDAAEVSMGTYRSLAQIGEAMRGILRDLALPYADHPDYRDEWKP